MTDSYDCFSANHAALAHGLPYRPNEQGKTLRRSIYLEMLPALSVTKSSHLKIT